MTDEEIIEFERLKTARDSLLLTVANLRGQLETIAAKATEEANAKANASWTLMCKKMVAIEREACAKVTDEHAQQVLEHNFSKLIAHNIRARGEQV